jgi:hypothetical protein
MQQQHHRLGLDNCAQVFTIISVIVALAICFSFGPAMWGGFVAQNTLTVAKQSYEQQYPAFEVIQNTLNSKLSSPPTVSCEEAYLNNPIESIIKNWIRIAAYDTTSINVLFYGEATLGKTCAVRKVLDEMKMDSENFQFFYHLYKNTTGIAGFVTDLCKPGIIGPDKNEAIDIALRKYNELKKANGSTTNAIIVIDLAISPIQTDLYALQELAKTTRDYGYKIRFVFIGNDARAPIIFNNRVDKVRLREGPNSLGEEYLQKIVGVSNDTQIKEIVTFTGSIFKYLRIVKATLPTRDAIDEDVQRKFM